MYLMIGTWIEAHNAWNLAFGMKKKMPGMAIPSLITTEVISTTIPAR